jgi:hypothetical protein
MRICVSTLFAMLLTMLFSFPAYAGLNLDVSPPSVNLPPAPAGEMTGFVEVVLSNVGNQDLSIQQLILTGPDSTDFTLATNCPGQVLNPSQSCSAFIALPAVFIGDYVASLDIQSQAGLISVPLSGTITEADDGACNLGRNFGRKSRSGILFPLFAAVFIFSLRIWRKIT